MTSEKILLKIYIYHASQWMLATALHSISFSAHITVERAGSVRFALIDSLPLNIILLVNQSLNISLPSDQFLVINLLTDQ